jgi:hypothetical protein
MATFYLDFENGNDANNGTTFANRWKSITSGATAARTAPGDTIRIMGSPAPTSLGQTAVWTSQALQSLKGNSAVSNATPISINISSHAFNTGDTVVVTSVVGNTAANGTWEITVTDSNNFTLNGSSGSGTTTTAGFTRLRNNTRVKLSTAVTQNIASTGLRTAAWTSAGGANVVTSLLTNAKEHYQCDSIAIQAAFTTGLAAYWPTGTLNLSGYQQVSFWIQQTAGTVGAASSVDLRLCSDTAGVTAVNTINIPNLATIGRWTPVTVDLGTNLGSSIRSIALYINTDNGAQTFVLNNIIACKASSAADSLTLTSLIGKNTTGETFWGIQSINGTRVMLDADTSALPLNTTLRGYYGTSETVTTWKRETIKLGPAALSTTALQTIQESGTDGSPITYSGGWDRTAMSTQNLETWLDGVNGYGYALAVSSMSFINSQNISTIRATAGLNIATASTFNNLSFGAVNNCTAAINFAGNTYCNTFTFGHVAAISGVALGPGSPSIFDLSILNAITGCGSSGINGSGGTVANITGGQIGAVISNCGGVGIAMGDNSLFTVNNIKTENNVSGGTSLGLNTAPFSYLNNCLIDETTENTISSNTFSRLASQNHDQTANNHKIFMDGGLISSATDQRKTASGISWKLQPTSSTLRNSLRPITLSLAKVACAANSLVTIKAWMRRDNTGLTMRLVCKGGQLTGVTSDVVSAMTAAANTWEEETITFTPTETGVLEITAECWGGTTYSGWVDDMTISQA